MIIALFGKKRVGKDYLANLIKDELEKFNYHNFKILHFADAVKQLISLSFDISLKQIEEYKNSDKKVISIGNKKLTMRKFMQNFAEAQKKIFKSSVWIDNLSNNNNCLSNGKDNYIISDVRFLNEYTFLYEKNAKIILIEWEGLNLYGIQPEQDAHISENTNTQNLYFDYRIKNGINKKEEDLRKEIRIILADIFKEHQYKLINEIKERKEDLKGRELMNNLLTKQLQELQDELEFLYNKLNN